MLFRSAAETSDPDVIGLWSNAAHPIYTKRMPGSTRTRRSTAKHCDRVGVQRATLYILAMSESEVVFSTSIYYVCCLLPMLRRGKHAYTL